MEVECPHYTQDQFVSKSLQGKLLYKDQCTKCFEDPQGSYIDLCLKCFNGSCGTHSEEHLNKFNHPVVLQIKVRPDEEKIQEYHKSVQQNEGQEITKLAIGMTGGLVDLNSNEFKKTEMQLKCLACKVDIPNEKLEGVIQSVKETDSAFKKQDNIAWEAEIFPCEHTLTLQQQENIKVKNMSEATCADCDLSTNLWMCLTCGNLGCGRKVYGGGGGNEHGISHGEKTGHPLVVKMGTITANGDASLYCYTCNNDVKDELLPSHLTALGLDINQQKKTEKTMTEMNVELNLNVTLSSIIEDGKQLDPVFGQEFTGLANLGNSCYVNSVLQVLFHTNEFKQRYYDQGQKHLQQCNKQPAECYYCQFAKLGEGLISGKYSIKKTVELQDGREKDLPENQKYYQDGLKIYDLKKMIAKDHKEFSENRMQDAMEYYQHLLQFIQRSEKQMKLDDITKKMFEFKQSTKMQCTSCGGVKYNEISTSELKLPVRKPNEQELEKILKEKQNRAEAEKKAQDENKEIKVNLEDPEYVTEFDESVQMFQEGDYVEIFCPQCQKNTNFRSQIFCKSLPNYLVIPVQRFVLQNWVPQKLNALINMPDSYDFSKFILKSDENEKLLPTKNEQKQKEPQYNEVALEMLMQMGMSKNRCIRALLANNNDPDAATNWMFERMDDPTLDDPIVEENKGGNQEFSQDSINTIKDMGFTEKAAKIALQKCDQNIERAMDFLFNHDNVESMELETNEQKKEEILETQEQLLARSKYELVSAIVHLGTRSDSGHYVAYVKINGKWYLFNDTKVAETSEPVLGKGYMYFFQRK